MRNVSGKVKAVRLTGGPCGSASRQDAKGEEMEGRQRKQEPLWLSYLISLFLGFSHLRTCWADRTDLLPLPSLDALSQKLPPPQAEMLPHGALRVVQSS